MRGIILFLLLMSSVGLFADFIVPRFDPVYEFLEMTHTLRRTSLNHSQYPLYYNDIIAELTQLSSDWTAGVYRNHAYFHLRRMSMNYNVGTEIAVWPIPRTLDSIGGLFRRDPQHHRLVTITEPQTGRNPLSPANDAFIYVSGILGFHYDYRIRDDVTDWRMRRYFGIETAGSFTPNFGYYLMFRKGHYLGDASFIKENPFLSMQGTEYYQDGDRFYQNEMISEISFKNPFLNLAMGYGSFDIGRSLSSSVILNSNVTPYGYFKFNKRFGMLEYNGITAQLTPERHPRHYDDDVFYKPKSMAIQTLALHGSLGTLGVGNSIIYGDRTISLAYSTPLAIYKIMDNHTHARDNGLFYLFGDLRPIGGLNLFANLLFDDIRRSRFTSPEYLSYGAFQAGIITQMANFPMEVGGEITAVGPGTYSHKSRLYTYMHDGMMLGHRHGSDFLSLLGRVRFHFPRVSFGFLYENLQQSDIGNLLDPNFRGGDRKFLDGNLIRNEFFEASLDLRLIPELHLFTRYAFNNSPDGEVHRIFTGAEFKY